MNLTYWFFAVFGGGMGALIGGGPAFILCGLVGTIGLAAAAAGSFTILNDIALGCIFIPCVGYVSGNVAGQYAHRRGYVNEAKYVGPTMGFKRPDTLLVGCITGGVAYALYMLFNQIGLNNLLDTGGLTVMILSFLATMIFDGKHPFGNVSEEVKKLRFGRFNAKAPAGLANCETGLMKIMIGLIIGVTNAGMAYLFANSGNEALASLVVLPGFVMYAALMILGVPAYFGAALVGGYAFAASGGSLMWSVFAAVITIYMTDFMARIVSVHSTGNTDEISWGYVPVSLLFFGILPRIGVYALPEGAQIAIVAVVSVVLLLHGISSQKAFEQNRKAQERSENVAA